MLFKKIRLRVFGWFWIILSFIVFASFLLLKASGYRINFKAKTIEKTGIIAVDSNPKNALLFLGGKFKEKTPASLSFLPAGFYNLKVVLDGYKPWERTVDLKTEEYIRLKATLFLENPKIEQASAQDIDFYSSQNTQVAKEEFPETLPIDAQDISLDKAKETILYKNDYEIWLYFLRGQNEGEYKIIARFSRPIKKVVFYPDYQHVVYVIDNEIRIIEISGTNDIELFKAQDTNFKISSDGESIIFQENEKYKKAIIR